MQVDVASFGFKYKNTLCIYVYVFSFSLISKNIFLIACTRTGSRDADLFPFHRRKLRESHDYREVAAFSHRVTNSHCSFFIKTDYTLSFREFIWFYQS